MTTQRRITRPGLTDNEYMTVTCTPSQTTVEFTEFQDEAEIIARENLVPTTTTYVGKIVKQGEHAVRGTSKHIAILVEVDQELAWAIRQHNGVHGRTRMASFLHGLLEADLDVIRSDYRARNARATDDEVTHPGVAPGVHPLVAKLVKPHVDRTHAAIDLAVSKLNPDAPAPAPAPFPCSCDDPRGAGRCRWCGGERSGGEP
jgi:hypothetical protein